MSRLTKEATQRRDQFETAQVMLGTARLYLQQMQLRVGQAQTVHGLVDLMEPAIDAGNRAQHALGHVRKVLNEIKAEIGRAA